MPMEKKRHPRHGRIHSACMSVSISREPASVFPAVVPAPMLSLPGSAMPFYIPHQVDPEWPRSSWFFFLERRLEAVNAFFENKPSWNRQLAAQFPQHVVPSVIPLHSTDPDAVRSSALKNCPPLDLAAGVVPLECADQFTLRQWARFRVAERRRRHALSSLGFVCSLGFLRRP